MASLKNNLLRKHPEGSHERAQARGRHRVRRCWRLPLAAATSRSVYKQGQYQGKPDSKPWDNDQFKGNQVEWEKTIKTRNQGQNEYSRDSRECQVRGLTMTKLDLMRAPAARAVARNSACASVGVERGKQCARNRHSAS